MKTGAHPAEAAAAGNCDWRRATAIDWIAELAGFIAAPTVGPVVGRYATAVADPRAHLAEPEPTSNQDRRQTTGGGAVAELATFIAANLTHVAAPAVGPVVGSHAAGVKEAGAYLAKCQRTGRRRGERRRGR
jgi:hypothetical protein